MHLQSNMRLCIFVTPLLKQMHTSQEERHVQYNTRCIVNLDLSGAIYPLLSAVKCVPRHTHSIYDARVFFSALQGKVLMLITNSDYHYTNKMMSFAYNRFMPPSSTWRDLFDMVGVFYHYTTKVLHDLMPSASNANAAVLSVFAGALPDKKFD